MRASAIKYVAPEVGTTRVACRESLSMNALEPVLWYIESHFARELTLDEIATYVGVSRFQMSRAFGTATGRSVMGYVRGRRLSVAARSLADGAPDILAVALDAGYGSHEAFTRAFRDQFGLTPDEVRAQRHIDNIPLVEPITMDQTNFAKLEPPRFVDGKPLVIAGLSEHYTFETKRGIPSQWQKFGAHFGNIPGQVGKVSYGVIYDMSDEGMDYLSGAEVSDTSALPRDFTVKRLPGEKYAVFRHRDHISAIDSTWMTIWNKWLPESGLSLAGDAPAVFERYGEEFDPVTGMGGCEIWIPIKA